MLLMLRYFMLDAFDVTSLYRSLPVVLVSAFGFADGTPRVRTRYRTYEKIQYKLQEVEKTRY